MAVMDQLGSQIAKTVACLYSMPHAMSNAFCYSQKELSKEDSSIEDH
jgi:hypothetical protein